jgi:hypothetical protein
MRDELEISKEILEGRLGRAVNMFSCRMVIMGVTRAGLRPCFVKLDIPRPFCMEEARTECLAMIGLLYSALQWDRIAISPEC